MRYCIQGSHFFPLTEFPDFSSISVIFPWLFSQSSKMQIKSIYNFKWGYNFKLKLHGDNWNVPKCYVCPQYSLIINMFFPIWNNSSTKLCLETTIFSITILLFSDLIFLDFSLTERKFPDFSLTFWQKFKIPWLFPDWKNFSHFSRFSNFSSAGGNPVYLFFDLSCAIYSGGFNSTFNQCIKQSGGRFCRLTHWQESNLHFAPSK